MSLPVYIDKSEVYSRFHARREAMVKKEPHEAAPVLWWPGLPVGAYLRTGLEESCQPSRQRFPARDLRDISRVA